MEEKRMKKGDDGAGNDDEDDEEDNDDEEEKNEDISFSPQWAPFITRLGKRDLSQGLQPRACTTLRHVYVDSRESGDIDLPSFLVAYFPSACVDTQINVAAKRTNGASPLAARGTPLETRERKKISPRPILFNPRALFK